MISAVAAPLIAGGAQLISSVGNWFSQKSTNQSERDYAQKMYNQQKQDAQAQWARENEYNSPAAQMARLKAAGLNPNLVYGGSAGAATGNASSAHMPAPQSVSSVAPKMDASFATTGMSAYFDVQQRQVQIDNMREQSKILNEEARLKAAQTVATLVNTDNSTFDLGLKRELKQYSLDSARESLRRLSGEADTALDENERRNSSNVASLRTAAEQILNMRLDRAKSATEISRIRADISRIRSSTRLQQLDENLKSMGINPNDPQWQRVLGQAVGGKDGLVEKAKSAWDGIKKTWKKIW